MSVERAFMLIKPDGVISGVADKAAEQISGAGLEVTGRERVVFGDGIAKELYPERVGGQFDKEIADYLTAGECEVIECEGESVCEKLAEIKGKCWESGLRGEYANNFVHNTVHSPDTPEEAEKELKIIWTNKKSRGLKKGKFQEEPRDLL